MRLDLTAATLRSQIESLTGGKVSVVPEVVVGRGKTRATLHGGDPILLSATVKGTPVDALTRLLEMARRSAEEPPVS